MELVAYLNAETHIPTETLSPLVHNLFVRQEVKKYDLLLKAKSHSQKLFYVEEGLLRAYYTKKKKDITHNFFMEKMFYLPVENIYYGQPSPFFLEALEESTVWVATFPEVERVVNEHQ